MADIDKDRIPSGRASPPGATGTSGTTGTSNTTGGSGIGSDIGSDPRRASGDTSGTRQALDETKRAAQDLAGRAKEQGRSAIEQQKRTAAEQVDSVAHAFRSAASQLQQDEQSSAGQYVASAAERLESFAQQLRQKDLDSMIREVEDLGRRSPATLFAGSLAAGFLLSRFLKSSRQSRHEDRTTGSMMDDDERILSSYRDTPDGAFYGEYAAGEWSGSEESGASELGMAASSLPEANTGTSPSPSTVVRSGDSTNTSPSSLNESKPGGNNYGNR